MNKVLVTGGLGIIGSYVCRALLAASRQPVIYDIGGNTALIRDIAADCVVEHGNTCDLPRSIARRIRGNFAPTISPPAN